MLTYSGDIKKMEVSEVVTDDVASISFPLPSGLFKKKHLSVQIDSWGTLQVSGKLNTVTKANKAKKSRLFAYNRTIKNIDYNTVTARIEDNNLIVSFKISVPERAIEIVEE